MLYAFDSSRNCVVFAYPNICKRTETFSGNGGGVQIPEWYAPNKNLLSKEEVTVLEELLQKADVYQSRILKQILARFGPDTYRPYKA